MANKVKISFSTPVGKILETYPAFLGLGCFLLLVFSNVLLAHESPSLASKMAIFPFGIILPCLLFFLILGRKDLLAGELIPLIPRWLWISLGALAIIPRFYHLVSLSPWPFSDEGIFGYYAIRLGERWDWRLLQCYDQEPILYSWILCLLFKLFGASLAVFWLLPAIFSLACVPAVWLASRKFLPGSMTFFLVAAMAVSFWPLYLGWFCLHQIQLVLSECLAFLALAGYLNAVKNRENNYWIYALAFFTGTGFYSYLAWPLVALLVGFTLLLSPNQSFARRWRDIGKFMVIVAILVLPLVIAYLGEYRGYLNYLWAFSGHHDLLDRFRLPMSCLSDFFWGAPQNFFHFGPVWGGFLNPILDALFFLGLVYLARHFRGPFSLWVFSAFFVFFLPAILTNNFEIMRLTPMVPLLLLICAVGAQAFLSLLPSRDRLLVVLLILLSSASLDFYHLFYFYPRHWKNDLSYYEAARSPEFDQAYSLLKPLAAQEGPGLILLNFHPDPYDQTLFVASYSFNAAENPKLESSNAKWATILANVHEEPFFKKMFPEGKWIWLSAGLNRRDGGFILEIVPINQRNLNLLDRWTKADLSLKELNYLIMELGVDPDQSRMMAVLENARSFFKDDRLLESRYWRIMALHHCAEGKVAEGIKDYEKAINLGHPMAHLYDEMGRLLIKENRLMEARKAFEEALRLRPNCTDADSNLRNLLALTPEKLN